MTADQLSRLLQDFLAEARSAVVMEEGSVIFDLERAKYSVSGDNGASGSNHKCVLHLWSDERNTVRRVLDAEVRSGTLVVKVLKFGQSRPTKLEFCRDRDRRPPSVRKTVRATYQRLLRRMLQREFPGWTLAHITNDMDLERSFGPVYTRALLKKGQSAFAVIGVNAQETQASIDAALTFGILWLDYCRERQAGRCHVEGLRVFVPNGSAAVIRERMAHLNRSLAKWQLYALEEPTECVEELDTSDRGNVETHLVHCPDAESVRERFATSIARVVELVPEAQAAVVSNAEVSFRLHGLEFARARLGAASGEFSFRNTEQITFGTGANETELNDESAEQFSDLMERMRQLRAPDAPVNPLRRMVPERWLESVVLRDVSALDDRLDNRFAYSQVPAFAASDRGMIDVLTCTRDGRLAILELKADEDIHLPLQGVDYWARVTWHHARGEFNRFGYFTGRELSAEPPMLMLVAPALHVHPATDSILRYIAPEIPWILTGIDEHWREQVRVVFRKNAKTSTDRRH